MTSRYSRTVSLRRARFNRAVSVLIATVSLLLLVFFAAGSLLFSGSPLLLIAPLVGTTCGFFRAAFWHRAIRRATETPDAMRWRP